MTDPTAVFLGRLGQRPASPVTMKAGGTIRVDVERDAGTDVWFIVFRDGAIQVSRQDRQPDLVIRGHQTLFDRLVRGRAQLYAALMRNEITVEGDLALLSSFERLLPGPEDAHHPRTFAREGGQGS
ncbi:SCP2 sterol-binding domain-containing protein [Micromonospora peucetia]|uniref:SCP2 sterol-binding domain-containing protein n=1 Tax=Micromonospora peucetia TaxID=47871 RepID=A0ABZ1ECI4_9ACTN|nr:SCP2 sterol-binding domain-containing protein [Micromonospora peucetia]WSA32222.1 SCP2 sterol-binding domain-containing protein [Micromonospora peucetia]